MWTHVFTLQALAREFDNALRTSTIAEVFTQEKNQLIVSTSQASGVGYSLVISTEPKSNFLFLRDRFPRAKKNSVDIFPEIVGGRLLSVRSHPNDRVISFQLDVGVLLAQLFGTAESNVFLTDENFVIRKAFKKNKEYEGRVVEFRSETAFHQLLDDFESFSSRLMNHTTTAIYPALKSTLPFLGSTYARETLHRAGIDEQSLAKNLSGKDFEKILSSVQDILDESKKPKPVVYFRNNEPRVFSVVPLHHLAGAQTAEFPSANEAIRSTVFRSLRTQPVESSKNELIRKLKPESARTARSLEAVKEELTQTNRAEHYERIANIIMANLQHLTKGTKALDLDDIFAEKPRPVRIEFNPKLTPAQNAEHYYTKAKKARTQRGELERRAQELETRHARLEKLLFHLDQCQTKEQVEEFLREYNTVLREWNLLPKKSTEEQPPFRVFTVAGTFEVWVGKSSENNDLLTMKYAKPNDLWFHVRGAGGSHVVLRAARGKVQPPKEAVRQAARIAAYFSKMRNASTVPVAYCERKYVRKPKRADPGAVVLEREKVIFVEPGLPA